MNELRPFPAPREYTKPNLNKLSFISIHDALNPLAVNSGIGFLEPLYRAGFDEQRFTDHGIPGLRLDPTNHPTDKDFKFKSASLNGEDNAHFFDGINRKRSYIHIYARHLYEDYKESNRKDLLVVKDELPNGDSVVAVFHDSPEPYFTKVRQEKNKQKVHFKKLLGSYYRRGADQQAAVLFSPSSNVTVGFMEKSIRLSAEDRHNHFKNKKIYLINDEEGPEWMRCLTLENDYKRLRAGPLTELIAGITENPRIVEPILKIWNRFRALFSNILGVKVGRFENREQIDAILNMANGYRGLNTPIPPQLETAAEAAVLNPVDDATGAALQAGATQWTDSLRRQNALPPYLANEE